MAGDYLHNAWYCAAETEQVGREPFARIFLNEPVVMYRKEDGTPVAMEDVCPHRKAQLSGGTIEGDDIQCPYHGLKFSCEGRAVWAQGKDKIQATMKTRIYPVADKHGWLWIWMGDPALADEAKIFDCSLCVAPDRATVKGMMHVQNAAMMAIDNLMDLSHTAFVHANTIGSADDLDPELTWERKDDWIKGVRKAERMSPNPAYLARGCPPDAMLHQIKTMAYTAPYNCNVDIFTNETDCDPSASRYDEAFLTYNMITPETDRTSFYFWANTRDFKLDDMEFNAINEQIANALLDEDRRICESVQRMTDLRPDRVEVDLAADAGGLFARRVLKRLIDAEKAESTAIAAE